MRPLANFIMRGRMQAILVVGISAAIPVLFWLSAAAAGLVLMRKGFAQAAPVLIWALIPAAVWAVYGDPIALLVICSTLALAQVLRETSAWLKVLIFSILLGLGCVWGLQATFAEPIAELVTAISAALPQMLSGMYEELSAEDILKLESLLAPVLIGLMAATIQFMSLLSLMLARYWQSSLYNPGGFGKEFHRIRLPRLVAVALVAAMVLAPNISIVIAGLTPLCAVVLGVAGLALVHGLMAKHKLSSFWLIALYVGLVFFVQLLFPLLVIMALADSLFDFRGLHVSKADTD